MEVDSSFDDDDEVAQAIALVMGDENDSDDSDGARGQVIPVDRAGWRHLSNASFKENFRMDRVVFERLVGKVGPHMHQTNRIIRERTPLDLCLMMSLWPLFNPDTFRSSGEHFGVKKAVIHFHYRYIIEVLREMAPQYIKWPHGFQREQIKTHFEETYGFPGCIGAIDGVHIAISAPLIGAQDYINRHHTYSILVQAVCDNNLLYRDVYCGEAGAIGDVRNFRRSPLSKNLLNNPDYLSEDEHLIGDGAYICTDKLLTPYVDDGVLTPMQRVFNHSLSAARSSIERSFCLLKGKHRRLKHLYMRNAEYVVDHIVSCFVLHNFMILEENDARGLPPTDVRPINDEEFQRLTEESANRGILKREYIAHQLYGE